MTDTNKLFEEIIETCAAIEAWFTAEAQPSDLALLLDRFSPEFRMITMQGGVLDKQAVTDFFGPLRGKSPKLRIVVDEIEIVRQWTEGACLTYRETQSDADRIQSVRRSTVVLEALPDQPLRWRHLQETQVSA
ncbi:DUF4440 domain-containing protein [Rhizobium sp. BR 314]|uniref:DUF4440 domain-containing protein n=1 Tax=Rhizobium sp. BR 314 TaxID=3040013 RepID=UPI0039BFF05A